MKIFVATGNRDKFDRVARWFGDNKPDLVAPFMLDSSLAAATAITDQEERTYTTMQERARAKAAKAQQGLAGLGFDVILAMDDTCYLPWIDTYVIDLRMPQDLYDGNKLVLKGPGQRLSGIDLANHYARLAQLTATSERMTHELLKLGLEDSMPGHRFMPIMWKFALAACRDSGQPEVIAEWDWTQYVHDTFLTETEDTGYVIGKISSDTPLGKAGEHTDVGRSEPVPSAAVKNLLM
ncbi:MAG: hypothetical protein TR69_WS6001001293 [candidate division WS6 bacterium OLB20]|uniref:Uncharacterized protein n=1 Tax=candidate division WS6 bacterium OLB20 TaxID=1617426 RepID=A0A136LWG6_9BACT|nr:MAG: hypothetical protein TR69_WS6001001293 [candidate division WS6 bacterium OLB20]